MPHHAWHSDQHTHKHKHMQPSIQTVMEESILLFVSLHFLLRALHMMQLSPVHAQI